MMPHIEKTKSGWKAVVETGSGINRKRRIKRFDTKRAAESWMSQTVVKKETGTLVDVDNITVAEWFEHFLKTHKKPKVATTTYDNYYRRFEAHIEPKLGFIRMQDLKAFHVEEFFAEKRENGRLNGPGGLSENTLKKIYVLMNQAFKKALKFHIINYNPLTPIESPTPKKHEAKVMKKEEFNKLIQTAKENDYFMYVFIVFLLFTGLRKSEALGLAWDCVDLEKKEIEIKRRAVYKKKEGTIIEEATKNEFSKRKIKISKKVAKLLKEYKKHQLELRMSIADEYRGDKYDLLFCRPDGYRLSVNAVNKKIKRLYKKAKLPYNSDIHILRHTFATLNVNNKVEAEIVQHMLGHSKITTTMDIYYHHDTDEQQEAVEKMDDSISI